MWDFIEHVPNPQKILKEANRILKPNGVVFILTTNEQSLMCWLADFLYKIKIRFFAKLVHPIHHNYHFSEKTLTLLLKKTKFNVIHKEKDEMPVENIEGSPLVRFMARILYLFSKMTKTQHEIMVIARKK
jgi:2-polyprenyl-3-methyl-5-hydroxy-6-metoxy-1,4-benzoquinol methylase